MLALALLLSAAAGVNANLGGEVNAYDVGGGKFVCADNCAHENIYLGQKGQACPVESTIRREDDSGTINKWFPFECPGVPLAKGWVAAPRRDGDKPRECQIDSRDSDGSVCLSYKADGEGGTRIAPWSEALEKAKSATASTTEKNKPTPPKSKQECQEIGRQKLSKCVMETRDFTACNKQAGEEIKNCIDGK